MALTEQELEEHKKEVERLNLWVRDLQDGGFVNCVYCGHRYGPSDSTPVALADALKQHVASCTAHPMAGLVTALREIAAGGAGAVETARGALAAAGIAVGTEG